MPRQSLNLPYITLTGVIVVSIIIVFVGLLPRWRELQAVRAAVQQQRSTVAEKESFLLSLDQKITALNSLQQHEQHLAVALPADDSLKDVVRVLHTSALSSGLTLTSVTNAGESERARNRALRARGQLSVLPPATDVLSVSVQGAGTYQQLRTFIEQLERSPRIMDILAISVDRDTANVEQLKLQLHLRVYHHAGDEHDA